MGKIYICEFVQKNGIVLKNCEFTAEEIKERISWWITDYLSVSIREKI